MFSKQNDTGRISRAGKVALPVLLALQAILSLISASAFAQTPTALPENLQLYTNGFVFASVRQADGGVVLGGHFSQVNGVARQNIARLKPDGTLDTAWFAEGSYFNVRALAADAQGNVYIGTSATLSRISVEGKLDPKWLPAITPNRVYALAIDSKGNLFAGGSFTALNGSNEVKKLAKYLPSGALDTTWTPNPGTVYALALDGDDILYVGGTFSTIGGQSRNRLAKISTTGSGVADPDWNPGPSVTSGLAQINALATDGAGNLYVGGRFDAIGGQKRNNIAKLSTSGSGTVDPTWAPSANSTVLALACDHKGSVYAGGGFTIIGGKARIDVAKLATDGTGAVDDAWNPSADNLASNSVNTITVMPDKIFAGGFFSMLAGQPRHSFAAIGIDGKPGVISDTTQPAVVNAIAVQANGGLIIGGYFSGAGDFVRSNVLRLQANGTVDPNWDAPTDTTNDLGSTGVEAVAVDDKTGAVYVGGQFAHVGGQPRIGIAKISGNGSVDLNWGVSTSIGGDFGYDWIYGVEAIALSANGDVYIGGDFNLIGGQTRSGLAKISGSGVLDPNWNPTAVFNVGDYGAYGVRALEVDSDGAVFVGGLFNKIGGQAIAGLAKLSGTGAGDVDSSWKNSSGIYYPAALKLDHKGNLYAAGKSSTGAGISKLSTKDGAFDPDWKPSVSGSSFVYSSRESAPQIYALALDPNGNLYAGGIFSQAFTPANWRSHPFLAKFSTLSSAPVDASWNPVPSDAVYALASDSKNALYVGGTFAQIGAQSRSAFAAVPMADAVDPTIPDHLNQFGWTGAWYNPATSGQGILLQSIPSKDPSTPGVLFGGWFTFDFSGNRRWYTFQGPVDNTSKIVGIPIYAVASNVLSPINPSSAVVQKVGDSLLSFSDCNHATLTFGINDSELGWQDSIPLTRLGTNYLCTPQGDMGSWPDYSLSGAWYDPNAKDFTGFLFAVDPTLKTFFAVWYTLDSDNVQTSIVSQRWYVLQAPFSPGTTRLDNIPMYETKGGSFGASKPVTRPLVGSASLVFTDCGHATLIYAFNSSTRNGQSGTINLSRGAARPANCNP